MGKKEIFFSKKKMINKTRGGYKSVLVRAVLVEGPLFSRESTR
jgi:hypothetical protein